MSRIKMRSLADMPKREATYLMHNMQFPTGVGQIVLAITGTTVEERLAKRDAILRVFDIIDSHGLAYTLCAPHPDDPRVDARIVCENRWMYLSDAIAYEMRKPTVTGDNGQGYPVMSGWASDTEAWKPTVAA